MLRKRRARSQDLSRQINAFSLSTSVAISLSSQALHTNTCTYNANPNEPTEKKAKLRLNRCGPLTQTMRKCVPFLFLLECVCFFCCFIRIFQTFFPRALCSVCSAVLWLNCCSRFFPARAHACASIDIRAFVQCTHIFMDDLYENWTNEPKIIKASIEMKTNKKTAKKNCQAHSQKPAIKTIRFVLDISYSAARLLSRLHFSLNEKPIEKPQQHKCTLISLVIGQQFDSYLSKWKQTEYQIVSLFHWLHYVKLK